MSRILDIHTHNADASDAIISVGPGYDFKDDRLYSVGIHPWGTDTGDIPALLNQLSLDALRTNVMAVGEAGIDKIKGAPVDRQIEILKAHISISEKVGKPLILHVVKAFPEIIRLKMQTAPTQPWIKHGFRGKPELARELVRHGFYISLGENFNPASALAVPSDRLLTETDESRLPIKDIAGRIPNLDISLPFTIFGIDNLNYHSSWIPKVNSH